VRFQDAINVDPRNGEAYYYLALTDFYLGQYDESVGLLDKAKALLGYDERWLERIENLKASIVVDDGAETQAQPL
jgi:tetratricopeptide (TPR) repeat protein